jgi:DNA repair exonuclease SbcCD nuclease subunit
MIGLYDNFIVVDKRLDLDNITFIPFMPDHTKFPLDTKEICIAHQTFIGADYGYMRPDAGVDAATVQAEIIISGHIHTRQEFGKVIYPGTPYAQSVNDINQFKGVLIFDTETYDKKFIVSPLPRWLGQRYDISPTYSVDDLHEELKKTLTVGDHWTVEIAGPRAEIMGYLGTKKFKTIKDKGIDLKVKTKFTDKDKRKIEIDALSMEHIIKEYTDKVYNGSIDKTVIIDKALEILNKVRGEQ